MQALVLLAFVALFDLLQRFCGLQKYNRSPAKRVNDLKWEMLYKFNKNFKTPL
jgi:hypothetical protein